MRKLFLLLLILVSFTQAQIINCKVIDVVTGDTISCVTEQQETIKIKLYQANAPKLNQYYGQEAKQALSDWVLNGHVTIKKQSKYSPVSGTVFYWYSQLEGETISGGNCLRSIYLSEEEMRPQTKTCGPWPMVVVDVNHELLKRGYAKHYPVTTPEYNNAEKYARKNKLGLWSIPASD